MLSLAEAVAVRHGAKAARLVVFAGMFFGYSAYVMARVSFVHVQAQVIADVGTTKGELGMVTSSFAVAYGLSKFTGGIMVDKLSPRLVFALGLLMSGAVTVVMGLNSTPLGFAVLAFLNGSVQGWGWPPCGRILRTWFSDSERGFWWSLVSTRYARVCASVHACMRACVRS